MANNRNKAAASRISSWSFIASGILVLMVFLAVLFDKCPSPGQLLVYRIMLSIGAAGLAAALPGFIELKINGLVTAGGAMAIFYVVYSIEPAAMVVNDHCLSFTVVAHVEQPNGEVSPFTNQAAGLLVGEHRLDPKAINANGEVIFDNIPPRYRGDTIRLKPVNPRFRVVSQSRMRADADRELTEISFLVEVGQDSTRVSGSVVTGNRVLEGATVIFDNKYQSKTQETGTYHITLPVKEGATCAVRIVYRGKEIFNDADRTVSSRVPVNFDTSSFQL
jgi:hypothetical protein